MRVQSLFFLLVAVLLAGCGTGTRTLVDTEYNDNRNVTTYESRRISIGLEGGGMGTYGGRKSIELRARASCDGQKCRPSEVVVQFYTDGTTPLYISDRSVTFEADSESYEWEKNPNERRATETGRVVGKIVEVTMTPEQLVQLARAERVSGMLGSIRFNLSFNKRKPLRMLAQRVSGDAGTQKTTS